jgi:hypothetical protein
LSHKRRFDFFENSRDTVPLMYDCPLFTYTHGEVGLRIEALHCLNGHNHLEAELHTTVRVIRPAKKSDWKSFSQGDFFMFFIQHCFICRPSDSTVSEDAGIEPRTFGLALAVRRSNHLAKSVAGRVFIGSKANSELLNSPGFNTNIL